MYCPSCGTSVAPELSYCNRCGANLKSNAAAPPKVAGFIWIISLATVFVSLGGFGVILAFLIETGNKATNAMAALMGVLLLVTLGIAGLLIRQLSRLLNVYLQSGDAVRANKPTISEPLPASQIEGTREPPISDAETATRILGPSTKREIRSDTDVL